MLVFNVFKSKIKLRIVALVLLTFIGQVSASTAFSACQMNMQSQNPQSTMQKMDHSSHMMNMQMDVSSYSDNTDFTNQMDCCQGDGNCSMNGCLSLVAFSTSEESILSFVATPIILDFSVSIIQFPSSLYRPPILS